MSVSKQNFQNTTISVTDFNVPYPQHYPVFNVEQDFLLFTVIPDKRMQCIAVRDPTNQATVGGQWDHSISLKWGKEQNMGNFLQNKHNIFHIKFLSQRFHLLCSISRSHFSVQ